MLSSLEIGAVAWQGAAELIRFAEAPGGSPRPSRAAQTSSCHPGHAVISPQSLVQIMTFESSINRLNYFKIVILIYTDIVLIIQAEIKLFSGADDGKLNMKGPSRGCALPGESGRGMVLLGNELAACGGMNLGLLEEWK